MENATSASGKHLRRGLQDRDIRREYYQRVRLPDTNLNNLVGEDHSTDPEALVLVLPHATR